MGDGQRNCRWRAKRLCCGSFAPSGWCIERYPSVLIQAARLLRSRRPGYSPAPPRDKRARRPRPTITRRNTSRNSYGSAFAKATARQVRAAQSRSNVIIHRELVRVWAQPERVVFFLFHVDPVGDEVFVKDVAAQQEGMIGLEGFDRAAE